MDNKNTVGRVIDGDTLITDRKIRVSNLDTPESVHKDSSRNTPKGEEASQFAKDLLPKGSEVETTPRTVDHFGRQVADVKRVINGVEVDYGLVALDQEFSDYYIKKGTHPDPTTHNRYKEYFSKDLPYQFGAAFEPMSSEEVTEMEQKHALFSATHKKFQEGEATQEELDEATVNLYGDPEKVVKYRQTLAEWNQEPEKQDPNGLTAAMKKAFELDPNLRAIYNRNIRNGHLIQQQAPEQEPTFLKKLTTSMDMFSVYSNGIDTTKLWDSRRLGENFDVPKEELLKGVPPQFHSTIIEESRRYNDQSALLLRDQLIDDVDNNRVFDNLEWYAQMGYGLLGTLSDPTSIVGGGVIAKGGIGAVNSVKAYTKNKIIRNSAVMSAWATGGATESLLINAPRLGGDHTYTARDLQLDVTVDAGLGVLLGGAFTGVSKAWDYNKKRREANEKAIHEVVEKAENNDVPVEPTNDKVDSINEKVKQTQAKAKKTEFIPWEAVDVISADGFRTAVKTLDKTFEQDSVMRKLMNSQLGLLKRKDLNPEQVELVNKLNADILHIASAFPDGNIPKNIEKVIDSITWNQKTVNTKHVIENLTSGKTSTPVEDLRGYVIGLEKQTELWEGFDVAPVKTADFYKQHSEWLNAQGATSEKLANLSEELPKELSFIKDVIELNQQAVKKGNPEFTELVEKLNGMVQARLEQREFGDHRRYKDSNAAWGKSVPMTAKEMFDQMRKEGLQPRTTEWSKRRKELESGRGRVAVTADVNTIGRADDFVVGTRRVEAQLDDIDAPEYYLREDQRAELEAEQRELEKKGELTAREQTRVDQIQEQLDNWNELKDRNVDLVKDKLDQDLLPRQVKVSTKSKAYKDPTPANLKNLRESIDRQLTKKLGLKQVTGKAEWKQTQTRLEALSRSLLKEKGRVIDRMVKSGKWENVQDVIRVANTLAQEAKRRKATVSTKSKGVTSSPKTIELLGTIDELDESIKKLQEQYRNLGTPKDDPIIGEIRRVVETRKRVDAELNAEYERLKSEPTINEKDIPEKEEPQVIALTEEQLEVLADGNTGKFTPKVSEEEFKNIKHTANSAYEKMVEEAKEEVERNLEKFLKSGEREVFKLLRKPKGVLDYIGNIASKLTEDLGTKMLNSDLVALEYFGARVTEIGKGFGGQGRRKATGGLMKEEAYRSSIMKILPQYVHAMDEFALARGKGEWARMNAQQQASGDNPLVKEFSKEVFRIQELRRQGRELPAKTDKSVLEFVKQWDKYMEHNHSELVKNGVGGFTKDKKIKHYIPHVWKKESLLLAESKVGKEKVLELLTVGYKSAIQNGTNGTPLAKAPELAQRQYDWIMGQDAKATDQWLPVKDSRAQQRLEIDTLTEIDGVSVLDLLENDVATVATKYSQRMSGWVGLTKSTDGLLKSELDIKTLRSAVELEAKEKGIDPTKHLQFYDDTIDLMFGRPTRGGLPEEMRMLKDLTALTRMGGLGTAQLIESGQVITRSVLNTFSDPKVAKKHIKAGLTDGTDERTLLREIQGLTNLTDDMEWLDRQSVHLDQAELNELGKMRQLSLWMADKGTWGKLKAPASRLLGKTSGFNMIRRTQSRITQMSFTMDIAKHFHNGSGKMGNKRMADLGLTDANGADADLQEAFDTHVEFKDGLPVKMNFDKWSDAARDKFKYAAMRDEAQQIQRTLVGELPPWMNKPIMSLIFQFRQMPLVATNKQLARSLAFADKEAVTAIMLNTAIAGLVRYSKFALLGLGVQAITDQEVQDPTLRTMQMDKYITQLGIFADAYDLGLQATQWESAGDFKDTALRQVPVLGLMNDYAELGTNEMFSKKQIDAAHGLVPLGNTAYGDMIHAQIQELNSGE